jgi:hypothetical protein
MKHLYRLAWLLAVVQLTCCTTATHTAQAPPSTRRVYQKAQHQHARERNHTSPSNLPWN